MKNKLKSSIIETHKNAQDKILYIIDLESQEQPIFSLKGVAIDFYHALKSELTEEEMLEYMMDLYEDCDVETIKKDYNDFLNYMKELKFVI